MWERIAQALRQYPRDGGRLSSTFTADHRGRVGGIGHRGKDTSPATSRWQMRGESMMAPVRGLLDTVRPRDHQSRDTISC